MCELQSSECSITERVSKTVQPPDQASEEIAIVPEVGELLAPKPHLVFPFQFHVSINFTDHILKSENGRSNI